VGAVIFGSAKVKAKILLEAKHSPTTRSSGVASNVDAPPSSRPSLEDSCASDAGVDLSVKPPLKWAGGKRWLLPHLAPLWRAHRKGRYVEPFCGGLAAALGLRPEKALLNDINPHLVNFYQHLQKGLDVTIEMENNTECFYRHRNRFNQLIRNDESKEAEAAQLFYYLNRTCFNGLCRFNQSGEFNVPFGTHTAINYVTDFSHFQPVFENWAFTNRDIELLEMEPEDFVYADPPYDVEFTTYSAGGFTWDDQVRTAERLAAHRGPVVLSNQATTRLVKLYKALGFEISYLDGPRRISCTGDRSAAKEVLAAKGL
jgi:DNA adenine methylase